MSNAEFTLDPRAAIFCAIVYSFAIALLSGPVIAFTAALPPLFLLLFTTRDWATLARRLRAPFTFIFFLCLIVPFTTPGKTIPGLMSISSEGLALALLLIIKCFGLFMVFSALVAPLSTSQLGVALHALHCPWQLIGMFLLMDMNLHIIKNEWTRLKNAAALRAFKPRTNIHTYRTCATMLALWLLRATERARKIHEGMLLRGFNGHFPLRRPEKLQKSDYVFTIATLCLASLFFIINLNTGNQ